MMVILVVNQACAEILNKTSQELPKFLSETNGFPQK